jgi:hypothetical protein
MSATTLTLAGWIADRLASIDHEPERKRQCAAALRVIAESLDDQQGQLLDLAADLEHTAKRDEEVAAESEEQHDADEREAMHRRLDRYTGPLGETDLVALAEDIIMAPWRAAR